jgi:putative aldouronate transport system substrate-binding protein
MGKFKMVLTVLLALMMALPITGAFAEGTRDAVPVPGGDWNVPYPELVTITTVKGYGGDVVFEGDDDHTKNPWTRAWAEKLGIEVLYDWVIYDVDGSYAEKLNMSIASGDLPDVFRVNYVQYRQLMEAGLLMDITDYYNENVSQRIRDYELTDPDTIQITSVDGRIYGIPQYYYGIIDQPRDLWVRKDWYEDAGSPELKTVEDFENLAKAFMEEYGGYGLAVENKLQHLYMTGPMFDVYLGDPSQPNRQYFWYADETGRIKPGIAHAEFKTALEYWAKWYEEGILSPDFVNQNSDAMMQDLVNGKAGFNPHYQWQAWWIGPNLIAAQQSDNAYMIPLPFPTVDGSQVLGQINFPNDNIIVVSKDCKNPAAVMKLLSYTDYIMFDPESEMTEEEFIGFTDGQREHAPGAFAIIDPRADMLQFEHVLHALQSGDTSELFTAGMKKKHADSIAWLTEREPGGLGAYNQQGYEGCAYDRSKFLIDNGFLKTTDAWGPAPEEFDQTVNAIDIVLNGVMEIIMGVQPLDYYDQVLANWYAGGGQIMEDAINALYGE